MEPAQATDGIGRVINVTSADQLTVENLKQLLMADVGKIKPTGKGKGEGTTGDTNKIIKALEKLGEKIGADLGKERKVLEKVIKEANEYLKEIAKKKEEETKGRKGRKNAAPAEEGTTIKPEKAPPTVKVTAGLEQLVASLHKLSGGIEAMAKGGKGGGKAAAGAMDVKNLTITVESLSLKFKEKKSKATAAKMIEIENIKNLPVTINSLDVKFKKKKTKANAAKMIEIENIKNLPVTINSLDVKFKKKKSKATAAKMIEIENIKNLPVTINSLDVKFKKKKSKATAKDLVALDDIDVLPVTIKSLDVTFSGKTETDASDYIKLQPIDSLPITIKTLVLEGVPDVSAIITEIQKSLADNDVELSLGNTAANTTPGATEPDLGGFTQRKGTAVGPPPMPASTSEPAAAVQNDCCEKLLEAITSMTSAIVTPATPAAMDLTPVVTAVNTLTTAVNGLPVAIASVMPAATTMPATIKVVPAKGCLAVCDKGVYKQLGLLRQAMKTKAAPPGATVAGAAGGAGASASPAPAPAPPSKSLGLWQKLLGESENREEGFMDSWLDESRLVPKTIGGWHRRLREVNNEIDSAAKTIAGVSISEYLSIGSILGQIFEYNRSLRSTLFITQGIGGENKELQNSWSLLHQQESIVAQTGQSITENMKVQQRLMSRGIKDQRSVMRIMKTSSTFATMMDVKAEDAADLFGTWNVQLGMSATQIQGMSRAMQSIARQTGLSGQHIMEAAKSSEGLLKALRQSGNLTGDAAKNVIGMMASFKKAGVEEMGQSIMSAMSGPQGFLKAAPGIQALLAQSAAAMGKSIQELPDILKDKGMMRQFGANFKNQIKNIFGTLDFKNMSASQKFQANITAEAMGLGGIGDIERALGAMDEASMTFTERLRDSGQKIAAIEAKRIAQGGILTREQQGEITALQQQQRALRTGRLQDFASELRNLTDQGMSFGDAVNRMTANMSRQDRADMAALGVNGPGEALTAMVQDMRGQLDNKMKKTFASMGMDKEFEELRAKLDPADIQRRLQEATTPEQRQDVFDDIEKAQNTLAMAQKAATDPTYAFQMLLKVLNEKLAKFISEVVEKLLDYGQRFVAWLETMGPIGKFLSDNMMNFVIAIAAATSAIFVLSGAFAVLKSVVGLAAGIFSVPYNAAGKLAGVFKSLVSGGTAAAGGGATTAATAGGGAARGMATRAAGAAGACPPAGPPLTCPGTDTKVGKFDFKGMVGGAGQMIKAAVAMGLVVLGVTALAVAILKLSSVILQYSGMDEKEMLKVGATVAALIVGTGLIAEAINQTKNVFERLNVSTKMVGKMIMGAAALFLITTGIVALAAAILFVSKKILSLIGSPEEAAQTAKAVLSILWSAAQIGLAVAASAAVLTGLGALVATKYLVPLMLLGALALLLLTPAVIGLAYAVIKLADGAMKAIGDIDTSVAGKVANLLLEAGKIGAMILLGAAAVTGLGALIWFVPTVVPMMILGAAAMYLLTPGVIKLAKAIIDLAAEALKEIGNLGPAEEAAAGKIAELLLTAGKIGGLIALGAAAMVGLGALIFAAPMVLLYGPAGAATLYLLTPVIIKLAKAIIDLAVEALKIIGPIGKEQEEAAGKIADLLIIAGKIGGMIALAAGALVGLGAIIGFAPLAIPLMLAGASALVLLTPAIIMLAGAVIDLSIEALKVIGPIGEEQKKTSEKVVALLLAAGKIAGAVALGALALAGIGALYPLAGLMLVGAIALEKLTEPILKLAIAVLNISKNVAGNLIIDDKIPGRVADLLIAAGKIAGAVTLGALALVVLSGLAYATPLMIIGAAALKKLTPGILKLAIAVINISKKIAGRFVIDDKVPGQVADLLLAAGKIAGAIALGALALAAMGALTILAPLIAVGAANLAIATPLILGLAIAVINISKKIAGRFVIDDKVPGQVADLLLAAGKIALYIAAAEVGLAALGALTILAPLIAVGAANLAIATPLILGLAIAVLTMSDMITSLNTTDPAVPGRVRDLLLGAGEIALYIAAAEVGLAALGALTVLAPLIAAGALNLGVATVGIEALSVAILGISSVMTSVITSPTDIANRVADLLNGVRIIANSIVGLGTVLADFPSAALRIGVEAGLSSAALLITNPALALLASRVEALVEHLTRLQTAINAAAPLATSVGDSYASLNSNLSNIPTGSLGGGVIGGAIETGRSIVGGAIETGRSIVGGAASAGRSIVGGAASAASTVRSWLPSFAEGTSRVAQEGLAMVHANETIVPANTPIAQGTGPFTPTNIGGGEQNSSLDKIVALLTGIKDAVVKEAQANPLMNVGAQVVGGLRPLIATIGNMLSPQPDMMQPVGTDKVPAMLTPGEFVVNAKDAHANMGLLNQINQGARPLSKGGTVYLAGGGPVATAQQTLGSSLADMTALRARQAQIAQQLFGGPLPATVAANVLTAGDTASLTDAYRKPGLVREALAALPLSANKAAREAALRRAAPPPATPAPPALSNDLITELRLDDTAWTAADKDTKISTIVNAVRAKLQTNAANVMWNKTSASGNLEEELRIGIKHMSNTLTPPETGPDGPAALLTGLQGSDKGIYDSIATLRDIEARRERAESAVGGLRATALSARGRVQTGRGRPEDMNRAIVEYMDAMRGMAIVRRAIFASGGANTPDVRETQLGLRARTRALQDRVSTTDLQFNIAKAMSEMEKPMHQAAINQLIAQSLNSTRVTSVEQAKTSLRAKLPPTRTELQTAMAGLAAGTGNLLDVAQKAELHAQVIKAVEKVSSPTFRPDQVPGGTGREAYGSDLSTNIEQAIATLSPDIKGKFDAPAPGVNFSLFDGAPEIESPTKKAASWISQIVPLVGAPVATVEPIVTGAMQLENRTRRDAETAVSAMQNPAPGANAETLANTTKLKLVEAGIAQKATTLLKASDPYKKSDYAPRETARFAGLTPYQIELLQRSDRGDFTSIQGEGGTPMAAPTIPPQLAQDPGLSPQLARATSSLDTIRPGIGDVTSFALPAEAPAVDRILYKKDDGAVLREQRNGRDVTWSRWDSGSWQGAANLRAALRRPPVVPEVEEMPFLAKGGIVTEPTIALIGEGGAEAVIPLDSPQAQPIMPRSDLSMEHAVVRDRVTSKPETQQVESAELDTVADESEKQTNLLKDLKKIMAAIEEKMNAEAQTKSVGNVEPASIRTLLGPIQEDTVDSAEWGTEEDTNRIIYNYAKPAPKNHNYRIEE